MRDRRSDIDDAVQAGACGYLVKPLNPRDIADAIEAAAAGGIVETRQGALDMRAVPGETAAARWKRVLLLSAAEEQVLDLLAQGLDERAIGERLGVSYLLVHGRIRRLRMKVRVATSLLNHASVSRTH